MSWWRRLLSRGTLDRQLDREIADHIERQARAFRHAGVDAQEARRRAAVRFGAAEAIKEECRDARGKRWLLDGARDLRHALRQMKKHPGAALVGALSLGLSIGAIVAIFSLVDAVLLRPLPVAAPDRLVLLAEQADGDGPILSWGMAHFQSFAGSPALSGVCAFRPRISFSVTRDGQAEVAASQLLSGGCYELLGLRPQLGRLFTDADDRAGASPVAVISDGFWRRQFAADPHVVGRSLELKGYAVEIVGVTSPEFLGLEPGRAIDISLPLSLQPWAMPGPVLAEPKLRWIRLIARLAPGVSRDRAATELAARWAQAESPTGGHAGGRRFVLLDGAQGVSDLRTRFARPLRVLFGAVALLLVLACANLASLTLARNQVRGGEVTLRLALGASRGRLVRQLFTESLALSLVAGALGLTIAFWASRTLVALLSRGRTPIVLSVGWDVRVLAFTMGISILASVLFGLWPALKASRADLQPDLQASARTLAGSRRMRGNRLIAAQTALSIVLVVAASLFVRSLAGLYATDVGVNKQHVMLVTIGAGLGPGMPGARNVAPGVISDFYDRLSGAPGIQSVTTAMDLPFGGGFSYQAGIGVPHQPTPADEVVGYNFVGPRFFETMGIPLLAGRDVRASDDARHQPVAVISHSLAQRYFKGVNPLGRHLQSNKGEVELVGVAEDVPYEGVRAGREPVLYLPQRQGGLGASTFAIRADLPYAAVATVVRRTLRGVAPSVPIVSMTTLADQFDASIASERLLADIAAFFGSMALLLMAIGMYGTLASALARRTREFGVRRALGASSGALVRMILLRALAPVSLGIVVGLLAALAVTGPTTALLFGVTPRDPPTYLASAIVLLLVAAIAAAVPARSAMRTSVVAALRQT